LIEFHQDLNFVTHIPEFLFNFSTENSISVNKTAEYGDLDICTNLVRLED
jgi:hypothetical protein